MVPRTIFALFALAGPAAAQTQPVYDFVYSPQPAAFARFGTSTAVLDWNGDGYLDLAVGAPGEGRVYLMLSDGHPTQPTYTFAPPALEPPVPQAGDEFGFDVFAAELDGDPGSELVVGAPARVVFGVPEVGAAYVFGLAGGTFELPAPKVESGRFGVCVASGDLDDDGVNDLVVTAPHALLGGVPAGSVHIFYGPFGGALRVRTLVNPQGATQWGNYGNEAVVEDVDGDGRADLIVSAIGNTSAGIEAAG
ncbi:MAG TPA: FG-GAP-like repeat-containing protein, partial [Planctomycetota bacterium]|nr:FG-GAP-like repeat-containing protein [Planctomycetota bacterium]